MSLEGTENATRLALLLPLVRIVDHTPGSNYVLHALSHVGDDDISSPSDLGTLLTNVLLYQKVDKTSSSSASKGPEEDVDASHESDQASFQGFSIDMIKRQV
jgi:hypothetical protein